MVTLEIVSLDNFSLRRSRHHCRWRARWLVRVITYVPHLTLYSHWISNDLMFLLLLLKILSMHYQHFDIFFICRCIVYSILKNYFNYNCEARSYGKVCPKRTFGRFAPYHRLIYSPLWIFPCVICTTFHSQFIDKAKEKSNEIKM